MAEQNPPEYYFNNINYNPLFYQSNNTSTVSTSTLNNYLLRIGNPISTATNTTFGGTLVTNGITNSTGNITTTTPTTSDNSTNVATTAFVKNQGYTTLSAVQSNSNNFTAICTALTPPISNNTTRIATTAFVKNQGYAPLSGNNIWTNDNTFQVNNTYSGQNDFTTGSILVPTQSQLTNNNTAVSTACLYNTIRTDDTNRNVSIGQNANPTSAGANNFALGLGSLQNCSASCSDNVGIGINSLNGLGTGGVLGYYNFALGGGAMQLAQSSKQCVAIGYASLINGTSTTQTTAIGSNSAPNCNSTGSNIFGFYSALNLTSGGFNNICGYIASQNLVSGSNNCFYGTYSGNGIITGYNNCMYGANTSASGDYSNSTCIGYNTVIDGNNRIIIGTSAETTVINGSLSIVGGLDASSTQTINFGTNAPTMSGANISSISDTALSSNVDLLNSIQTFSAKKTFTGGITATATQTITFGTNAPIMSGANITSIPDTALSSNVALLIGTQHFTGAKTFGAITFTTTLNTVTPTIFGYISTLSSNAQTQINTINTNISNILNGTSAFTGTVGFTNLTFSGTLNTVSTTVFGYISGLTSSAQTQLNTLTTNISNILNGTSAFTSINYGSIYNPYTVSTIASTATLTTPLSGTYIWAGGASYTSTLPVITTQMLGIVIKFRRITAINTNTLTLTAGTGNTIFGYGAVTSASSQIILTSNAVAGVQNYQGTLICVNSTQWAILS